MSLDVVLPALDRWNWAEYGSRMY